MTPSNTAEPPSVVAMLLSLVSRKSSSYFRLLLELGAHGTFPNVFNEQNVAHVLSLLRLVCSWQVHEIMRRYEQNAARTQQQAPHSASSPNSGATPSASTSQDFYASLTAPFTFWGIVHSLSVVGVLRSQYLGALHWFLSPRNLAMQVEIFKVLRDTLYGEEEEEEQQEDTDQKATERKQQREKNGQVPAPSPLHAPSATTDNSSPFRLQRLRERRLRSLSRIAQSVHNSGILQAIFTFPLATAHFYSVWVADMLWPTRRLSVDAYFAPHGAQQDGAAKKAAAATEAAKKAVPPCESVTDLLIAQLGALLHTSARLAGEHGFLHIPSIRSACLEGVQLALEETVAYGSGASQRAAEQAQAEREAARQARREAKAARAREIALAQAEAVRLHELANAEKLLAKSNRANKRERSQPRKSGNAIVPSSVAPSAASTSAPPPSAKRKDAASDMFSASRSLRLSSASPSVSKGSSGPTDPVSTRAVLRVQGELQKLAPLPPAPAGSAAADSAGVIINAPSLDSVRPVRVEEEDIRAEEEQKRRVDPSAPATTTATAGAGKEASPAAESEGGVSLPPPFSFEVSDVDEDDEERASERERAAIAAASGARSTLHTESGLDITLDARRILLDATTPTQPVIETATAAPGVPVLPSLPQRHRLLYSFFQLLLAQPIVKLVVTAPSLWEMLSDVGFLELLTVALFGPTGAEDGGGEAGAGGSASATSKGTSSAPSSGPFRAARALLSSTRSSLHAWQRLVAHWRLALFLADLRERHFEVALAEAMSNILTWLASEKGRALTLAVMDALAQRDASPASSMAGGAGSIPSSSSSLAQRFHSLTQLLSHKSSVSLLTSPRFWLLFADTALLRYFSHGQYLRLWLHGQKQLRQMHLQGTVWSLLKQQGAKAVTAVRLQAANKLANQAQKLSTGTAQARAGGAGVAGMLDGEWDSDDSLHASSTSTNSSASGGSGSTSSRAKLKGFVKSRLSGAAATAAARLAQPSSREAAKSRAPAISAAGTERGSNDSVEGGEDASPPPVGLAALQHFFSLTSSIWALLSGSAARNERIRAAL